MKTKALAILLVLGLMIGLLSACGGTAAAPSAASAPSEAGSAPAEEAAAEAATVPASAAWAEGEALQAPSVNDMAQTRAKPAAVNAAAVCDLFMRNLLI